MAAEQTRYTRDHEWVRQTGSGTVLVGITEYAAQQLGDIVFVQLPRQGDRLDGGSSMGEIESTKSVSDLYAPFACEVIATNQQLEEQPEVVNSDPFGGGWMIELRPDDQEEFDRLLDEAAYRELIEQQ